MRFYNCFKRSEIKPCRTKRHFEQMQLDMARKVKMFVVVDLNQTQVFSSEDDAMSYIDDIIFEDKKTIRYATDEELLSWYDHSRYARRPFDLEIGDILYFNLELDEDEVEDIEDSRGRVSGKKVINQFEPDEIFSSKDEIENEMKKRNL